MTSQVAAKLAETKTAGRPALIGYLPNGFPDSARGLEAAQALLAGGVDILELGIPYTDPVMDGPTIQRAAEAALEAGS
ncbi:MAG: tryptophan synthase subunit alpha, partial [Cellulomonadaceae bacterium]|nr:tryptophan synthase subunit alpha [Cellulomonadaceae bacterium]